MIKRRAPVLILAAGLLILVLWTGTYRRHSSRGSYQEKTGTYGLSYAVWFPGEPDHKVHPLHGPLLWFDRVFVHKTIQMQSGEGDMPRLYEISSDGKGLIPTKNR